MGFIYHSVDKHVSLQNTPFGNISLHLPTFSSILPVRETFSYSDYFVFMLKFTLFLLKFHAPYVLCLHGFFFCNHRVTAFFLGGGFIFFCKILYGGCRGPKTSKGGVSIHTMCMLYYEMNRGRGGGCFSNRGIARVKHRVSGDWWMLSVDFGGGGH